MPVVQLPNKKILEITVSNKCGITTAISVMCYPLLGKHKARGSSRELLQQNLWAKSLAYSIWQQPDYKICIVRDPVKRIASCYADRVLIKNRENVKQEVYSWDIFLTNLAEWQDKYRDIRKHTYTQVSTIGKDPSIYDEIFTTEQLSTTFLDYMETISGVKIPPTIAKDSRNLKETFSVSDSHIDMIKEYYKEDYEYWGSYFQ